MECRSGRVGPQRPPQVRILGTVIGSCRKEQAGRSDGKICEVGRIGTVRPRAAIKDERIMARNREIRDSKRAW